MPDLSKAECPRCQAILEDGATILSAGPRHVTFNCNKCNWTGTLELDSRNHSFHVKPPSPSLSPAAP
jgi:RNase P subunit RPR2